MSMNLAICQVFCANLANNTALLGAYQGAYGIGGTIGPIIATALVSNGYVWSRYYFILLGIAIFNLAFGPWSFLNHERESITSLANTLPVVTTQSSTKRKLKSFRVLMSHKPTVLGSLFIFAYQGAEVAISGWVISFLVQFRHGDPSKVGYVTSGFWAGITLGGSLSSNSGLSNADIWMLRTVHAFILGAQDRRAAVRFCCHCWSEFD
tara:strand:+ start:349 stop:972 length:624 start_codon:yes stop_codon:yes gene_type:complete